jgi:hypothetical protein
MIWPRLRLRWAAADSALLDVDRYRVGVCPSTLISKLLFRIPVPYKLRYTGVSKPRLIGIATQLVLRWNTGTGDRNRGPAQHFELYRLQ